MLDLLEHPRLERLQPRIDIVVGDIGIANNADLAAVRTQSAPWDDTEHKLVADRFLADLASKGFAATYQQRSFCGGVLVIHGDE